MADVEWFGLAEGRDRWRAWSSWVWLGIGQEVGMECLGLAGDRAGCGYGVVGCG